MAEEAQPVRVLLLARAGEARQRLEAALSDAGVELLRAVDPVDGDAADAMALRPGAVLVALEPAIEDALERYDALLSDPGVLVMFDEAEVAARRDGWDAARWVRHLAAKLNGHADVLPPGAESEEAVLPEPGPLPARDFDPASIDIGAMAGAAQDLSADVPRLLDFDMHAPDDEADAGDGWDGMLPESPESPDAPDTAGRSSLSGLLAAENIDWSSSSADELSLAEDPGLAELVASVAGHQRGNDDGDEGTGRGDEDRQDAAAAAGFDATVEGGLSLAFDDAFLVDTDGSGTMPAGASDAVEPARDPLTLGDGFSLADDDAPLATRVTSAAIDLDALESRFEGLSLAGDEDGPIAPRPASDAPAVDLDALSARLDGLSLADPESYGHGQLRGAVVVEAGIGGPDAVRQLLGGLGADFARAVLVRLQLDGGRYERLVQQMQRASVLPVQLAEPGQAAEAATVYFLPPGITVAEDRAQLRFADSGGTGASGYDAMPAADSALVFLSGADIDRVERALAMADAGALVLAQAPESCYDAAAVTSLVGRGAVSAEPGDLAQALIDRWP